jgi:ABC-type lipoprotein export system ATPase subunit
MLIIEWRADTSYWLSWHLYQSALAFINALLIYCFGCIFQFKIFLKNDFGVMLLTFWLHGQAMVGLAFIASTVLARSTQAVAMGFATFLIGFVIFFMVGLFEFPYGGLDGQMPFAYDTNITTGKPIYKTDSGVAAAPILALIPPSMLVQDLKVMGRFTLSDEDSGMRMANISNYCTPERSCDPNYSLGKSWEIFIALYLIYSAIALYLDNVLADAMGVRKPLWYFVTPAYWGLGKPYVKDCHEVVEASTDPDVLEEEARIQARMNETADSDSAIEVRGLIAEFRRSGKPFFAVKAPWYKVKKNHLLALLGPNGAGKTTTVNMLTGFIPPSRGNALVMGRTVAHPAGMSAVRRVMGVCPQFDTLWATLTAREHLQLFAAIKGVAKNDIPLEAMRRIEEVRLTDAADRMAGTYSGGMRRRLSVAIALIGNIEPQ